jgi:hypothetical protein
LPRRSPAAFAADVRALFAEAAARGGTEEAWATEAALDFAALWSAAQLDGADAAGDAPSARGAASPFTRDAATSPPPPACRRSADSCSAHGASPPRVCSAGGSSGSARRLSCASALERLKRASAAGAHGVFAQAQAAGALPAWLAATDDGGADDEA